MTIYTRCGAPVQIIKVEKRLRWLVRKPGRLVAFDKLPTTQQMRGATIEEFTIWWIRAKQIGAYPDGTGIKGIGKFLDASECKDGFLPEEFFRADEGIREIHAECEMKAGDNVPEWV
jgi:hypothetical protein